ncbi:hypothetical protein [Thomasclavelia cocleata]|uniref:hypothetical protein n=1 Tax=Thomasclavelia cocleata TaxID=69824 RepID=UPI00272EAFE7|nr:hypothetical protein [Thomasclavelia cocleata]
MFSIILSILAIVISIITLVVNLKSLKQSKRQNQNAVESLQSDAMMNITQAHKTLFLDLLKDEALIKIICPDNNVDEYRKSMIGTLLINHCNTIFTYASKALIEEDDWNGLQNDISDFFTWPVVKKRWPQIRRFYSLEFQTFVDDLTVKGRIDNRKRGGVE